MDVLLPWRPDQTPYTPGLKPHQREIVLLVEHGLTNDQIAVRLGTTPGWVGMQIGRIVQRLGLTCRADIVAGVSGDGLGCSGRWERMV